MRAARCNEYGPPDSLVVEELPDPVPGQGEVVVLVEAAAVNYPDVLIASNRYQISVPVPFTPGSEFAGVVGSVGDGVTSVGLGDRVYGGGMVGAFAQQVVTSAAGLTKLPDGVDLVHAAAFKVVYLTSYHVLRSIAEVRPGDWVCVLGAAGGVGLAAVELAQVLGGRVVAAASSDEKLAVCRARGAEAVINYETEDLKLRLREITDGGADVVVDPVGGRYSEEALRSTRWGGRFVTVGFAAGEIPRIPLNLLLLKGVILRGFEIRTFSQFAPESARRDAEELWELFTSGRIQPYVSAVHALDDVAEALNSVADRRSTGKVVIDPRL